MQNPLDMTAHEYYNTNFRDPMNETIAKEGLCGVETGEFDQSSEF